MSLEDALALSVKEPGPFELFTATGTDGRRWYLAMDYWRTGRVLYRWLWDGRCEWIEEVAKVPAGVDWAPGILPPSING